MNVKIKARVAILKSYMTLLGFKDPKVTARIHAFGGGPITFKGKEEIELDQLGEASKHRKFIFSTEVVITLRGHHTGLNNVLAVNKALPLEYIIGAPEGFLHHILKEAEDTIHAALYEQAKAKAVIRAADLL